MVYLCDGCWTDVGPIGVPVELSWGTVTLVRVVVVVANRVVMRMGEMNLGIFMLLT